MRKLDDSNITKVELFVQEELLNWLQAECKRANCEFDERDKHYFFGPFVSNINKFRFLPGERNLIDEYSGYVTNIMKTKGINYFESTKTHKIAWKNIVELDCGLFFGERQKTRKNKKLQSRSIPSNETLIAELVTRLSETKKFFLEKHSIVPDFDISVKDIKIVNIGNRIIAVWQCPLCEKEKKKQLHVQYDVSKSNSTPYWNPSNVSKHLRLHASKLASAKQSQNQVNEIDNRNKTGQEDRLSVSKDNCNKSNDESLILPKDNPVDITLIEKYEDMLYQQVSRQNLLLAQSNLTNNPKTDIMKFIFADRLENIKVVKIIGDGNCLFSSIVHQLFCFKLNSSEHYDAVHKLRSDVVDFIRSNLKDFEFVLKHRISPTGKVQNMEECCNRFLDTVLNIDKTWGGSETTLAVSKMYKVNVITFSEEDIYILPCGFNTEYSRTILLAFRGYSKGNNQITIRKNNPIARNHFDSVFEVQQDVLKELAKKSAKIEAKKFIER